MALNRLKVVRPPPGLRANSLNLPPAEDTLKLYALNKLLGELKFRWFNDNRVGRQLTLKLCLIVYIKMKIAKIKQYGIIK